MSNKQLTNQDYCEAAKDLRCEVAALMAVAEVESAGGGYDEQGRIKVRFEGHKFREYTHGKYDQSHSHLSYPYKLQKGKPHGYEGFNEAFTLDEEAALKASSFGKFQPLAVNYREAGFKNVRAFVDFLRESERNQLIVFCLMVKFRAIDDELRRKDWAAFAWNYNGSAYRDNDYDGKMSRAYDRYKKLKINCNEFADLREEEIELDIPTDYSASGDTSRSDAISAPRSDEDGAEELTGSGASDREAAAPPTLPPSAVVTSVKGGGVGEAGTALCKERPSSFVRLWTLFIGAIGAVTGLGVNVQSFFERAADEITVRQIVFLVFGFALIALAMWIYDRSANRANKLNLQKMENASDPQRINTELIAQ